jgi:hypothetical protein
MVIAVDLRPPPPARVRLDDPDDVTRFHVAIVGSRDQRAAHEALARNGVGRLQGEQAFISVDAVRRLAEGRVGQQWETDFVAMLDYAAGKGWLDADRTTIEAHVEFNP